MKNKLPSSEIFENLREGYYEINFQGEYIYVNTMGTLLAQKTKEEMIGKKVQDVFADAQSLPFGKIAKEVIKDRKQRSLEAYYPRFDKWFENIIYPTPQGIGIFARDITQMKHAEHEMAKAAALIDSSEDAIITKSREGLITGWNAAAQKLYGYTPEEILGKPVSRLMPPDRKNEFPKIMKLLLAGKRIGHYETQRITKTKKIIDVSLSVSPIRDSQGNIIGAAKIARDITGQKLLEKNLQESEARLRLALGTGKIGVWDWDIEKDTMIWTEEVYKIYDVSPATFIPSRESITVFIHPEDKTRVEIAMQKSLHKQKLISVENKIITTAGETKWINMHGFISRSPQGKPIRMLGAITDITERRKLEQEKNDFVSIATHELKTPVTSIKAYAEVLEKKFQKNGDMLSATQLGKMNTQLNKLTSLISDLLDATKIEAGKLQTYEEKFSFDELVAEIVEELQRTTQQHTIKILGETKKQIFADRERTGQVITNLISNAIKYSPNSSRIQVLMSSDKTHVQLCVQDFGIGIPKTKQNKLFERFYRVSGPKEKTFPGLGLGLYISSEIIKRQEGKIWVESEKGKGSIFCFKLPLRKRTRKKL